MLALLVEKMLVAPDKDPELAGRVFEPDEEVEGGKVLFKISLPVEDGVPKLSFGPSAA